MKIYGKELDKYMGAFDPLVPPSVLQFLQHFKCCDDLQTALEKWQEDNLEEKRVAAEAHLHAKKDYEDYVRGGKAEEKNYTVTRPQTIIGFCPKCNSKLMGEPVPGCESKKSGRHFYAECSACNYYYEIFKIRNKYKKSEGGLI
jgi:hypothetical protein